MYGLVLVPLLTDLIETGALPQSPRAWLTEIVMAFIVGALVRRVARDMRDMSLMARVDALTGLWNRRGFHELLEEECLRARRTAQGLTLVYLDLDNFKQLNDRHGHAAGDEMLRHFAAAMQEAIRMHMDSCFRVGGDEFAVLLPGSSSLEAEQVIARIRSRSFGSTASTASMGIGVTCGIVQLSAEETVESFVRRADQQMYRAKTANSCVCCGDARSGCRG